MIEQELGNLARGILKKIYGENATFREGQYEAIIATLKNKRTLVVQKTGWGKSLVYFISTKILRGKGNGVTLVISPLLVLMENQKLAAETLGLKCEKINSQLNSAEKQEVIEKIKNNMVDLVFITPESLFIKEFQENLPDIDIGLMVIDEAHCISDWGHDFRLKYGNIYKILKILPDNVPILATTATANNRVIEDLEKQLGNEVFISRGKLMRNSLSIQVLELEEIEERYAWILENINKLPGTGIIYCLTQRDCQNLADFLNSNGIEARAYYSRGKEEEKNNEEAEALFSKNQIKVIVATVKLGMGYDKGDVSFVIHFQQPSNVVTYYQQIGRAGRNLDRAYTFLMTGKEDKRIQDYFIDSAFPTRAECEKVLDCIHYHTDIGLSILDIEKKLNLKHSRIEKTLMFLENGEYIVKEKSKYYSTIKIFKYDEDYYNGITEIRRKEQKQMLELVDTKKCYNQFVVNALDDMTDENCGCCKNCLDYEEFSSNIQGRFIEKAQEYLERLFIPIEPRKRWAKTSMTGATKIDEICQGIALSKYGVYKYGKMVERDKYSGKDYFCEELLDKSYSILLPIISNCGIQGIVPVPSLRSNIVLNFAQRLAEKCGIKYIEALYKTSAEQQKKMVNSSHQCENALKSFHIKEEVDIPENIILFDDIVDSKWTLTVCGNLLKSGGASLVFPFALADSSNRKEEE